jgi:site-specific recombinase XerD
MTLNSLLADIYAPLRGISPRTVKIYRFTLKAWEQFLGRPPEVSDLEELAVAQFLSHRLRERSVATAAKDRTQIRALWEFAARRKLCGEWPQIRRIRVPERVPQAWLTDELQRLLDAAGRREGVIAGVPARLWWRSIVLTGYEVGERIAAMLAVEWRDISPAGILLRAETRKGATRDIWRPISPECHAAIEATRTSRVLVWEWDRCYTNLWRHLGMICKDAGLPDDRWSKFHRIRKTHASYAAAAGLDAQRLLDHASPKTTRAYLDPRIVKPPSAPDVLPKVG